MKKYTITLTEYQLALIAACVEDVHRFLCGDTKLHNTTSILSKQSNEHIAMSRRN